MGVAITAALITTDHAKQTLQARHDLLLHDIRKAWLGKERYPLG